MSEERVLVDIADHVATVTMNRPEKHNALDAGMFEGLLGATLRLREEPGVRAVVLHGKGPSFCSGIDIGSLMSGPVSMEDLMAREEGQVGNLFQRVCTDWTQVPVPVIAAIQGNCFGGGLQIALGADLRIAAPDAKLRVLEIKWGLVPDMGITQTLPRLLGIDKAKELTFTGREVRGEEADRLGLVTSLADDPLAAAHALAADIASRSPQAIRAAKQLYDAAWAGGMPAADALILETELQVGLMGSPNQIAAVTAGMTKQPAEFTDPGVPAEV
ncbi:MAG: crotonase/enoyl-CoA hydratase family protein [Solirubrobacterales bacterium]|nr:crotonase/enoyl-CoA hydratase family protein [Solirubrobacterales bacterium]